jgi:hypothetical protein
MTGASWSGGQLFALLMGVMVLFILAAALVDRVTFRRRYGRKMRRYPRARR